MKKALVFMANGFEEIEAVTLIDLLRRADIHVDMCSVHEQLEVTGSHGIKLKADNRLKDIGDADSYDAAITPGGLPGATNLRDNDSVIQIFRSFYGKPGKILASICAAPIVLGKAGIGPQIAGTCYPGFENEAGFREYRKQAVVVDKNVVTSMGPGTAFRLAIKLIELLAGEAKAGTISDQTMIRYG